MAQKAKIGKKSTSTNAGYITPILYVAITCQQIELESWSSPLQMGKSCSLDTKKNFKLVMLFFFYVYIMGGCLCEICLHLDDIIIPCELTNRAHFVAQSIFGY